MPTQREILKLINTRLKSFAKSMPRVSDNILNDLVNEINRLDVSNGRIKTTVKNINTLASIRKKLERVILTPEYRRQMKLIASFFVEVSNLQAAYWKTAETTFTPSKLLKAIRKETISQTLRQLLDVGQGIKGIEDILKTNITSGGSIKSLRNQLVEHLADDPIANRVKQLTTDAINQYNRTYTKVVSSDLGYVWYRYIGSEIVTSRGFCQSMVENNEYFHISQVPQMLRGMYLGKKMKYTSNEKREIDSGKVKTVRLNERTGLPSGFIEGTNAENFFVRAGGYSCGHSIYGVPESSVPKKIVSEVKKTASFKRYQSRLTV